MKPILLSYGKRGLPFTPPSGVSVTLIEKKPMPLLADPATAMRHALEKPDGSPPLRELARNARSVAIAICDITRPVPNGLILEALLKSLSAAGVADSAITVIVATGLHRPNEGAELREVVGSDEVLGRVSVVNHFAERDDDHVSLGTTQRGTPVKIDRRFIGADLRIVAGLVEPHFFAGYSGGRKLITPGLAHADTIRTVHNSAMLRDRAACNCRMEGNPLHEEQIHIVGMVGHAYAVNTVIDDHRRIAFLNFGEIKESHAKAAAFVRPYAEVPLRRKFKTVVTTSAGYPLDKTYYQAIKGMKGVFSILEPGGALFIAAECSEGLGSADFRQSLKKLAQMGRLPFLASIEERKLAAVDEWQTESLARLLGRYEVRLFSEGIPQADRPLTAVVPAASLDEAVAAHMKKNGETDLAVIPEGPYTIPVESSVDHTIS